MTQKLLHGTGEVKTVTESMQGGYIPKKPTVGWMRNELVLLKKITTGQSVKESEMISALIALGYPIEK